MQILDPPPELLILLGDFDEFQLLGHDLCLSLHKPTTIFLGLVACQFINLDHLFNLISQPLILSGEAAHTGLKGFNAALHEFDGGRLVPLRLGEVGGLRLGTLCGFCLEVAR